MQKEQKNKIFARIFLDLASKKDLKKILSLPESEAMMKEQWDAPVSTILSPETKKRLKQNIYQKTLGRPRIYRYTPLIRVAAVFLIGLLIGGIVLYSDIFTGSDPIFISVVSPAGQRTPVELPDGSKVILAGSGRIEYPENFSAECREVHLSGMAFFDVKHQKNIPFRVKASEITISVLGTRFSVASYPGDPVTETVLLSGKVQVDCPHKNISVTMKPGERHTYNNISKLGKISKVDASRATSWIDGKIIFDQEDIYNVCKKLERWYGVEIEIVNRDPQNSLFTFTIDNNTLNEVLVLMQKVSPIQFDKHDDVISITFSK